MKRPSCLTSLIAVIALSAVTACRPVTENVGSSPALPGCSTGGRRGSGGAAVASGGHAGSFAGMGGMLVAGSGGQAGTGVAGSAVAGAGVAGSVGGQVGFGGVVGSGGEGGMVVASGGVVGSGGVTASGGAGGAPATHLGWIPCTSQNQQCTIPAGTVRVLYGDDPDGGTHRTIKTFANAAPTVITCDNSTFGGNPNLDCSWCDNWCWYEGQVAPILPAGPLTGPQISLPVLVTPYPGYPEQRISTSDDHGTPNNDVGAFREPCGFAKFDFNDPIVFPGQAEVSHLHLFFGNTAVTEASTPMSIQTTGTSTCAGGVLNRSAYWVPAMIDTLTHQPVRPSGNMVYYKTGGLTPAHVHAIPPGLVMVTGDPKNKLPGVAPVRYGCDSPDVQLGWQLSIPSCPDTTFELTAEFTFPQCWDGVHLDSPDHKSHMSDPVGSECPADHPVGIPLVSYNVHFPITRPNASADYRLSSDNYPVDGLNGGYSGHADYMMGWDVPTMDKFITNCLQPSTDCHGYLLGNGQTLY